MLKAVRYHGSSKHKLHPHLFDLPPFQGSRGDATLCDDADFQPADMAEVRALLLRGIRAGLIGHTGRILWTVANDGWIFEARETNPRDPGVPRLPGPADRGDRPQGVRSVLRMGERKRGRDRKGRQCVLQVTVRRPMSLDFQILIRPLPGSESTELRRLAIRFGDQCLTRLIRRGNEVPDDCLEAPPLPLAFWITDNWWRIRFEPAPYPRLSADWRLAHDVSSAGAGYAWPNVSLWGEGERFALAVHADAANLTPHLQFLANEGLHYLPASTGG